MNERIKELAVQTIRGWSSFEDLDERIEKFAELILFECIKIAVFKGDAATGRAIKEHFGVEE